MRLNSSGFITLRSFASKAKPKKTEVSVQDSFQRLTPLEHILTCPNMYVGSTSFTEKTSKTRYVISKLTSKSLEFERTGDVSYVPGLVKIFDELLVNACDNTVRDPKGTTQIHVSFCEKKQEFTVENNGAGIPIELHKKEKVYIPELVLGHLLTGSNFDQNSAAGGRHGYGAKLCNVFSTSFAVETLDELRKKRFSMVWKDNMRVASQPIIVSSNSSDKSFTRIRFVPDWEKFNLPNKRIDTGSLQMIQTRVVETAGLLGELGVTVTWNGSVIPLVKNFASLCQTMANTPHVSCALLPSQRLSVGLAISHHSGFEHTSFVNNMSTWRGGTHVEQISMQLTRHLIAHHFPKSTDREIKRHLELFVSLHSTEAEFDSQLKDRLTSSSPEQDAQLHLPDSTLKTMVSELNLVEHIKRSLEVKSIKLVNVKTKMVVIPKLEDALLAGSKEDCTLILTEGDSAKASAMCGLEVVGRKHFGVYPLRGKFLNVREASLAAVAKNAEIKNLLTIIGLKIGTTYSEDVNVLLPLRYKRVMFMADGDHDGSHIKGLLLNFFDVFWPELARRPGFLTQFVTPVLKAFPVNPTKTNSTVFELFSVSEFNQWKRTHKVEDYRVKYYKGLGTSSPAEAKAYFKDLSRHVVEFKFSQTREADCELLDLVFSKSRAGDRKKWLENFVPQEALIQNGGVLPLEMFINQELIQYSWHDVFRSIPHLLDGLKPSQRKILFALFQKNNAQGNENEFKVSRLSGFVAEQTSYHHGEDSLHHTMIKMAQDFVGGNNLPLLLAIGQFGSRATGGDDASAARYLHTGLSPIARLLFPREDDALLERKQDDGVDIEPVYYLPIVPLVLINGSMGVGTGWSSFCPQFHPKDVSQAMRAWILKTKRIELTPWYAGFKGSIVSNEKGFETHGTFTVHKTKTQVLVEELPIGCWTDDFKDYLKEQEFVQNVQELGGKNGELRIQFTLSPDADYEFLSKKLTTHLSMRNLHFCMGEARVAKFDNVHEILDCFGQHRLDLYTKRLARLKDKLEAEVARLSKERDFVHNVVSSQAGEGKTSQLLGQPLDLVYAQCQEWGFSKQEVGVLLKKPLQDFTLDRVKDLQAAIDVKTRQLNDLATTTPQQVWLSELTQFERAIDAQARFEK